MKLEQVVGVYLEYHWMNSGRGFPLRSDKVHISDDGVGMESILQANSAGTLGFMSMRERTELTGGILSIDSRPDEGTTVRACWSASS